MNCIELKCARIRCKKSMDDMAKAIGKHESTWAMKERGEIAISLEEAAIIGRELNLTEQEFIAIFFDTILPFRNDI